MKSTLARWYLDNRRNLPWRKTRDPYLIWVSEIILQQTRVDQGIPFYRTFIRKFPDLQSLAKARERTVLKTWQGMGYYARAHNMLATARMLVKQLNGKFPADIKGLMSLKGVGPYTAAAIGSIAFGIQEPVLDGNVYRFLSRYFGVEAVAGTKEGYRFNELATDLLDKKNPGQHNQAVMEFGALQCTPVNPDCPACPVKFGCYAFKSKKVSMLPLKTSKPKTQQRYFHYFIIHWKGHVVIQRRASKDIWRGLYEFPLVESGGKIRFSKARLHTAGIHTPEVPEKKTLSATYKHQLTHQTLYVSFYELTLQGRPVLLHTNMRLIPISKIGSFPVPRLIAKYMEQPKMLSY